MKPLVSIIIPSYNHGDVLPNAINSCLQQTHRKIEIIIIDDGSTDNTRETIKELYSNIGNIRYFYQKNRGVSSARNRGIKRSRGDYIQFLDADDILLETKLSKQLEQFKKTTAAAVHSDFYCLNSSTNNRVNKGASALTSESDFLNDLVLKWEIGFSIPCHCFLFKRESLRRLKFKRKLLNHEDWEFYVRWASKGNWSEYSNQELCVYMKYPSSLCTDIESMNLGYNQSLDCIAKISRNCRYLANKRKANDCRSAEKSPLNSRLIPVPKN